MSYLDILNEAVDEKYGFDREFAEKLAKDIKDTIQKIFPKSGVFARVDNGSFGTNSIDVRFTVGKDKSEYPNQIVHNDIVNSISSVWFEKDGSMRIETGLSGFSITTKPTEKYLAQGRTKVPFRKTKVKEGDSKKVLDFYKKTFTKLKEEMKRLLDEDMFFDPTLVKSKL